MKTGREVEMLTEEGTFNQIREVEELGSRIGYGNMMFMASALYRYACEQSGYLISSAPIPSTYDTSEQIPEDVKNCVDLYDDWINAYKNKK